MSLADIGAAVEALKAGLPVIAVDDEDRENEGDIIMAAEHATPEWLAWIIRVSSGFVCAPMSNERADALSLPLMTEDNKDSLRTAYTITVDAAGQASTGISATDRARTLRVLADAASGPADLIRPGHILPLRAVEGGVRQRPGHTEAAVDLLKLAGLTPVGVIAEVVADDGEMMRLPELLELGREKGLPVISIAQLVEALS
ncbi:3,4-dihydroxy-2-butanone-4-phosphate synthase [Arthrobacter crusticola]|uniref:3,4-dihydroxy-2-butanone 4-phosphate synthase n=1 Tax=Arthrobacter crusticola TaxID=2547960 RepID=A0A4R5U3G5_9MICC|nr:3,4-dihydroxy-2-butanone-4-phosphate synthase [Arthrobacter crusticola]